MDLSEHEASELTQKQHFLTFKQMKHAKFQLIVLNIIFISTCFKADVGGIRFNDSVLL